MLSNNWLVSFAWLWNWRLTEWICWRFLLFNLIGEWINSFSLFSFLSKWIYCFLLWFFYLFLREGVDGFLFLGERINRLFLRLFLLCKWIYRFSFFLFSKRVNWSLFLFFGEGINRFFLWLLLLCEWVDWCRLFRLLFGKWIECILLFFDWFLGLFFQMLFFMLLVWTCMTFAMATFTLLIAMNSIDNFIQLFFRNAKQFGEQHFLVLWDLSWYFHFLQSLIKFFLIQFLIFFEFFIKIFSVIIPIAFSKHNRIIITYILQIVGVIIQHLHLFLSKLFLLVETALDAEFNFVHHFLIKLLIIAE